MKFLTEKYENPIILQIDISIPKKLPLTIISIKGTSNILDLWLDVEMFLSSALLNFAKSFPFLFEFEQEITSFYTKFATLPMKYLEDLTLTSRYSNRIDKIYLNLTSQKGYSERERTYMFVGHSLGGGLAKYMSFKENKQGFSVSGPGVTPLENLLNKNVSRYQHFRTTFIDVVPDLDLVPRVELSGGIQYRILCQKGILSCHSVDRTLCMMGVMCGAEHLIKDLCLGIFGYDAYQYEFLDVVHLNHQ